MRPRGAWFHIARMTDTETATGIIIFEPDPLIGEDLRDAALTLGVPVQLMRHMEAAGQALRQVRVPVFVLSQRSYPRFQAHLEQMPDVRLVLREVEGFVPNEVTPAATLPDPFTHDDVVNILRPLVAQNGQRPAPG